MGSGKFDNQYGSSHYSSLDDSPVTNNKSSDPDKWGWILPLTLMGMLVAIVWMIQHC